MCLTLVERDIHPNRCISRSLPKKFFKKKKEKEKTPDLKFGRETKTVCERTYVQKRRNIIFF